MEDKFKIETGIDGQHVKADCRVDLGRFLYLAMTAPYHEINTMVVVRNEYGDIRQFDDCQEAMDYACQELESIMGYIKHVKQFRNEYAEASHFYKERYSAAMTEFRATEASRRRGWLGIQSKITDQILDEYDELVCRLIPSVDKQQIIYPNLLEQVLLAI